MAGQSVELGLRLISISRTCGCPLSDCPPLPCPPKQVSQHPRCRLRITVVGRPKGDKGLAALRAVLK